MTARPDLASAPMAVLSDWLGRWTFTTPGRPLGVAVSGGGDSTALLLLLAEAGAKPLYVYTVDHGLRPEAAAEAAWVAALAGRLGAAHRGLAWRYSGQGNISAAARSGRYHAIASACAADGVADCLLAHTRDDNIETLVLGLFRGAGLDGLAGMRSEFQRGGVTFHRPLLEVSRAALRQELTLRGQDWHEDPTNSDLTHDRARVRHLLAALDLPEARLAQSLRALAATRRDLGQEVLRCLEGWVTSNGAELCIALRAITPLSEEFRRRIFAAALKAVSGAAYAPRGPQLMRLARRDWQAQPGPVTLAGCRIKQKAGHLVFGRELAAVPAPVASDQIWDGWRLMGPHRPGLTLAAVGAAGCAQLDESWRKAGIAHATLLASPALWEGGRLLAAALAAPILADEAALWRFHGPDLPAMFEAAVLAH